MAFSSKGGNGMSPQTGSVVLYACAAVMGLLGINRMKNGFRGRAMMNFVMAALMVLFGMAISLGSG